MHSCYHCQRRIQVPTQIVIPYPMATLYCAQQNMFPLRTDSDSDSNLDLRCSHGYCTHSLARISLPGSGSESVSGNVSKQLTDSGKKTGKIHLQSTKEQEQIWLPNVTYSNVLQVFYIVGPGALHPWEGDAEGSGGSAAAQGDHGLPEDGPRLVRL